MFLNIIRVIPFIGSAFSFSPRVCWRALVETLFLWFISSLPILFSIFSAIAAEQKFGDIAKELVNSKVLFAYTSSFLAPVIFLLAVRLVYPRKEKIFAGAMWIVLATITIVAMSAWSFQNEKLPNSEAMQILCYGMYVASIYFWWLANADNNQESFSYGDETDREESAFVAAAQKKDRD